MIIFEKKNICSLVSFIFKFIISKNKLSFILLNCLAKKYFFDNLFKVR